MYWIEKLDLLKRRFPSNDFKDPFRSGKEVIVKIVAKLFNTTWLNFVQSENRVSLLNLPVLIKSCTTTQLYSEELIKIDKKKNYWLLMIDLPMGSSFQVYDCKLEPIRELLYLSYGHSEQEFCIVDKKYAWLLYYKIDRTKDHVEIYKSSSVKLTAH